MYPQHEQGENAVRVAAHVRTRVPLHSTALGRSLPAFMPRDRVEAIVDRHGLERATPNTVGD